MGALAFASGFYMPQNRLMEIRVKRGLTQAELAEKLNTSSVTVGRYEKQDQKLDLTILSKLSRVLDCSIAALAGEVPFELAEDNAAYVAPLDRARLAKVIDALDHYLAENKMRVMAGGRSDLILAIYDWSLDQKMPVDEISDLTGIRSLLRPALEK